ncbi:MAG: alkaline phosphatase D family protein [Steroidobacteraceae bacterium]
MATSITRRRFVQQATAATALAGLPLVRAGAQVRFSSYPFKLGVSSGDPAPDGFVIWTRLAPEPFEPEQLGTTAYEVDWEVAEDAGFQRIASAGRSLALAHLAHSIHVEVTGLQPGRDYHYRFRLGRYESPPGRALTLPAAGETPALRFALGSCAHYEHGFFAAYRYMAADRPDLILGLGDYIYEDGYGNRRVRLFHRREAITLADYRNRYAEYQVDPDLQAAHAACPWLVTWDDHEVDNDYAALTSEHELCGGPSSREAFVERRAAAYQAWYEHMPVRQSRLRAAGGVTVYGAFDWGSAARLYLLDTRQYRSAQACAREPTPATCDTEAGRKLLFVGAGGGRLVGLTDPACRPQLEDPSRTMLGAAQEDWLDTALTGERCRWNLLAYGTPFAPIYEGTPEAPLVFTDGWSAYPVARQRLLDALVRHRTTNPVMMTGDLHAFFVSEVRDQRGRTLTSELVTSSIANSNTNKSGVLHLNPHIRYHEWEHSGYTLCEVEGGRMRADMVGVDDIRDPRTARQVLASFEFEDGNPIPRRIDA